MMPNKLTSGSNMRREPSRMTLPDWRDDWVKHRQEQKKAKKPVLDGQRWEELEWILHEAMGENAELVFTYWKDGYFYDLAGWCHFVNMNRKQFHIKDSEDDVHYVPFDQLTDIQRKD